MAEIKATRLLGLNVAANPRDLKDNELSDMTNLQLLKTGELVRRKGLRPLKSERLINTAEGKDVITKTARIRYRQVYTTGKEYLDVFAVGNKVWIYDEDADRFSLLYESPGEEEVDIDSYLGYILVTSHDSNLAILKRHLRSVYLIDPDNEIIKSAGTISGNAVDFETEDTIDDSNVKDIDIDQTSLYSISESAATRTETITPASQEVKDITLGTGNTWYQDVKVRIGYDDNHTGSWDSTNGSSDTFAIAASGTTTGISSVEIDSVTTKDIDDFVTNSYYEPDLHTYQNYDIDFKKVLTEKYAVYSGLTRSGNNLLAGSIRALQLVGDEWETRAVAQLNDINLLDGDYVCYAKSVIYTTPTGSQSLMTDKVFGLNSLTLTLDSNVWAITTGTKSTINAASIRPSFPNGLMLIYYKNAGVEYNYSRAIDLTAASVKYSAALAGGTETTPTESNTVEVSETTANGTSYALDVTVPEKQLDGFYAAMLNQEPGAGDFNFSSPNANFYTLFDYSPLLGKSYFSDLDTNGEYSTSTDRETNMEFEAGKAKLYFFKPYYRILTAFTETNKKYMLDSNGEYPEFDYDIDEFIGIDPLYLDVSSANSGSIEVEFADYGSGSETEYTIEPDDGGATSLQGIELKQYSKDNFDITNSLLTFYSDNTAERALAKNTNFFYYIEDDAGSYLMAFNFEGDEFHIIDVYDMSSITGDFQQMRSFTAHTGRQYIAVLTDEKIYVYRLRNGVIVEIANYTEADINDISIIQQSNETHIYGLKAQNNTTILIKLLSADLSDELQFDTTTYEDPGDGANEIPFYVNDNTNRGTILTFVKDDTEDWRIVVNDISGDTPDAASRYLEFQVDSSITTNYTKLLSDFSVSHVEQVKPINTPVKPTTSAAGGANNLTGRYRYFYVAKEWSGAGQTGNILYESYPSELSIIADVTAQTITLAAQTDGYTENNSDTASVEIEIYRSKITDYDQNVRTSDFFQIYDGVAATAGSSDGLWTIPQQVDGITDAAAEAEEKYKGYTDSYPRCQFVEVFQNVVYLANDQKYSNNIYFSDIYDPTTWQPQKTLSAELFSNDVITGLSQNDGIYVFTRDSVSLLAGVGTTLSLQVLTREVGCVDARTLQLIQNQLFFLSERGFYRIRNYEYSPIDVPVSDITHQFTFGEAIISYYDNFTQEYRVIYDDNKILCYSVPMNTWFKYEYPYDKIMIGFSREDPETDIPKNVVIVRNDDADGNETYRMLVEDGLISYDFIRGYGATSRTTQAITSSLYTKKWDMDNGYADKIWRRFFVEALDSHSITASISVDDGEFTPMVNQERRSYFNDVPLIWYRFRELYGDDVIDSGTRGIVGKRFDTTLNQDGKIDRCYSFADGAYVNIGDVPQMNRWSIGFWFFTSLLSQQCVLSDGTEIATQEDEAYASSDFTNEILDSYNIHGLLPVQSDASDAKLKIGDYEWSASARTFNPIPYGTINYSSGTDVDLNNPDDSNNTQSSFVPCADGTNQCNVAVGNNIWDEPGLPGTSGAWVGRGIGSAYGYIRFAVVDAVWGSFASSSNNGLKTMTFNGVEGSFDYYYDATAWSTAFNGAGEPIVIAQNGSVYWGSISAANLVVTWDGYAGPKGGGTALDNKELLGANDSYNHNVNFVPARNDSTETFINAGGEKWDGPGLVGQNKTYTGLTFSGAGGSVRFEGAGSGGGIWASFAGASLDGMQRMWFPGSANNDRLGGYVDYIFDSANWTTAVNGVANNVVVAQNGSVYDTSISAANLITRWDGVAGPAGGGSAADTNINEWVGQSSGSTPGAVTIETAGGNWDTFSALDDGLYHFNVTQGIYYEFKRVPFYYHAEAWERAFSGNSSNVVIAKSGAVYKDSIEPFNLVVTENGDLGLAGVEHRGEVSIFVNTPGPTGGIANCKIWDGSTEISVNGGTATQNTWNHVMFTFDETSLSLYVNGALTATTTHSGTTKPFDTTRDAFVGKYRGDGVTDYLFTGKIDDLRIYNSTLTAQQVSDIRDFGRQYQQYERKTYVPPKSVSRGRSAMFKLESSDYMQVRQIAMEHRVGEMR
jgi:hypothetical protein